MKKEKYNVAIVGATGAVGEQMREVLEERQFPVGEMRLLASERSAGQFLPFQSRQLPRRGTQEPTRSKISTSPCSPPAAVSAAKFAPMAVAAGAVVVDNTSVFRMEPDIPLVVPEVNAKEIANYKNRGIIANPNCSTIQMVVALKPIHDAARIKRVVVSTYQSVSGAGRKAMEELSQQVAALFNGKEIEERQVSASDRFQLHPAYRRFHGRWLHQGRVEDDRGDPQDSRRAEFAGDRDDRAGAGVLQPLGIGQCRDLRQTVGQRSPADSARSARA